MSKQLIIAEKPSVALDISKALGGFTRQGDYFESDEYVLSSAVGHLLELAVPEEDEHPAKLTESPTTATTAASFTGEVMGTPYAAVR